MRLCVYCFERVLCDIMEQSEPLGDFFGYFPKVTEMAELLRLIMEKIKRLVLRKNNTIPTEVFCDDGSVLTDITDVFEHWLNCSTEVKVAILIISSNYLLK